MQHENIGQKWPIANPMRIGTTTTLYQYVSLKI